MAAVRQEADQATTSAPEPAARAWLDAEAGRGETTRLVGRRVKFTSVLAPIAFVIVLEACHYHLENSLWWTPEFSQAWHLAVLLATSIGIGLFAWLMISHLGRAESAIVTQNQDLRLAREVSSAVQDRPDAQAVAAAAAEALAAAPGVACVRLRLHPGNADAGVEAVAGRRPALPASAVPTVTAPLVEGGHAVGRLEVWSVDGDVPAWHIGPATQSALALQVAGAAELALDFADLYRRRDEGHAFYAILLAISRNAGTLPTLTELAGHARDLLSADAAAVIINVATANVVRFDSAVDVPEACSDGTTLLGVGLHEHLDGHSGQRVNPTGCTHWRSSIEHDVMGISGHLGSLWVGRTDDRPFTDRDRSFLATMAGLAGIALTSAKVREQDRQRQVLNERTRIAREMHDSMAQVLGAMHLRLRMLESFPSVAGHAPTAEQVAALADTADEAYRDVREVILGLRDSDRADLSLEDNLQRYTARFAEQSGIATEFRNETGGPIELSPRTEVHLIRVVQEALTNVRKHARASRASVTVTSADDSTTITIVDDGRGFRAPAGTPATDGYGLFTMRDRLSLLHGTLTLESHPGTGTRVVATVPERSSRIPARS